MSVIEYMHKFTVKLMLYCVKSVGRPVDYGVVNAALCYVHCSSFLA